LKNKLVHKYLAFNKISRARFTKLSRQVRKFFVPWALKYWNFKTKLIFWGKYHERLILRAVKIIHGAFARLQVPLGWAQVNTSKPWEWNEVDEMFSLMDFYYLLIMSSINTMFQRKSVILFNMSAWSSVYTESVSDCLPWRSLHISLTVSVWPLAWARGRACLYSQKRLLSLLTSPWTWVSLSKPSMH